VIGCIEARGRRGRMAAVACSECTSENMARRNMIVCMIVDFSCVMVSIRMQKR
jgi:hypothetical protein